MAVIQPTINHLHTTIRHGIWAAVAVCAVFVGAWVYTHHPDAPVGPTASTASTTQNVAKTVQGLLDAVKLAESARNATSILTSGIGRVAPHIGGISTAGVVNTIAAAGRMPTRTVYSANYTVPSPAPKPTAPPGIDFTIASWHHADTVSAVEEALAASQLNLHIAQEEIPPNRICALYLTDGSAGACYAIARRKQLDMDLGVTTSPARGLEFVGGLGFNLKHTDAGVFAGVVVGKKPGGLPGSSIGIQAGLVIHP